jgi:hypothetical protein
MCSVRRRQNRRGCSLGCLLGKSLIYRIDPFGLAVAMPLEILRLLFIGMSIA